jgi:hypothetical protein
MERGIEANLDKCDVIIKMETASSKERIIKVNDMLTSLNIFISRFSKHAFLFYRLLGNKL